MSSIIVIGSGVAGMTAALEAVGQHEVTLITKADLDESNTRYAQGGVAVVSTPDDSVESHYEDTLTAGAGLSDHDTAHALCEQGPDAVQRLIDRGVQFDKDETGGLAHGLEAAHAHARILHAGGDATGAAIAYALIDRIRESKVRVLNNTTVIELIVEDGKASGVRLLGDDALRADAVILATGGAGQLFPFTTNPDVATGDGVALALRAGAVASDLELYQFHPTSLDAADSFLISEAVRGEGAVLIDADGKRFMTEVHPDAELAPRDVVARGIAAQMAKQPGKPVRLDATAKGAEFLAKRFPTIDAACRARGFEWGTTPIPVTPAAHYYMGGVRTDSWGRTTLPGLYAVGEAACNGLHGANRLASNSLLEGAVYGIRVVEVINDPTKPDDGPDDSWTEPDSVDLSDLPEARSFTRDDLQHLMWDAAGLVRDEQGLTAALATLRSWHAPEVTDAKSAEDANLLLVARAVVACALARKESRGGHYRSDLPDTIDPARHSSIQVVPSA